jgi:hypothetical protein
MTGKKLLTVSVDNDDREFRKRNQKDTKVI